MEKSAPFFAKDGFSFHILTPEYSVEAEAIVVNSFVDEPTAQFLESDRDKRRDQFSVFIPFFTETVNLLLMKTTQFAKMRLLQCCSNGLSVMCIDDATGNLAGVAFLRGIIIIGEISD